MKTQVTNLAFPHALIILDNITPPSAAFLARKALPFSTVVYTKNAIYAFESFSGHAMSVHNRSTT